MASVGDFVVVQVEQFELPRLDTGFENGYAKDKDLSFTLPSGTQGQGVLVAEIATVRGLEDHIDLSFSLFGQGYTWNSNYATGEFLSRAWVIGTKASGNSIRFALTKGGAIQTPKGLFQNGGAGRVRIANVVVWYRRTA